MDSPAAISVLKRVLCHLPTGIWWQLHQRMAGDLGITKAFDLPVAAVDVLLVVAGVAKRTASGFCIVKSGIHLLCDSSDGFLEQGNIRCVRYIANISELLALGTLLLPPPQAVKENSLYLITRSKIGKG